MNKEEYLKALEILKKLDQGDVDSYIKNIEAEQPEDDTLYQNLDVYAWQLDVFEKLINEHLDLKEQHESLVIHCNNQISLIEEKNKEIETLSRVFSRVSTQENSNPPLKFEELHEGMWVWDNYIQMYFQIWRIDKEEEKVWYTDNHYNGAYKFEKNRFFRHEVKEVKPNA